MSRDKKKYLHYSLAFYSKENKLFDKARSAERDSISII